MDHIILTNAARPYELCRWADTVQEGVDVDLATDFQVAKFFRGTKAVIYDRINQLVTLNFIVCQEWADEVVAFDKVFTARRNIPRTGTLAWTSKIASNQLTRYVVDCGLRVRPLRRMGVATWIQYTVIGGEISITPPSSS